MRTSLAVALGIVLLAVPLVGCLGDGETVDRTETEPPEDPAPEEPSPLPDTIQGLAEIDTVGTDGSGTGVWIDERRDILLSANGGGGLQLYNVSDPENVDKLGSVGDVSARDVDLLRWNGTPYAVLAGGGEGIHVVDVTNPDEPEHVATADRHSAHNIAAVPGTPYVYDATGDLVGKATDPVIPVLDLTDPDDPGWSSFPIPSTVNGQPVQSDGCHDVVVRPDLDQAFCAGGASWYVAGGGETFIWNISDGAAEPTWEGVIDNPSIMYHHQALASEDGNLLFINDEFIAPNCNGAGAGPVDARQSTAALWIYDISDPESPELRSYLQVSDDEATQGQVDAVAEDQAAPNCGSHFGDLVDGRDFLTWGWYQGGTILVDVTDPDDPQIAARVAPGSGQTWEAEYYEGVVYGSSADLQVLDIVGEN